jgi:hypothetical protein
MGRTFTNEWRCDLCLGDRKTYYSLDKPVGLFEVIYKPRDDMESDGYMVVCQDHVNIMKSGAARKLLRPEVSFR